MPSRSQTLPRTIVRTTPTRRTIPERKKKETFDREYVKKLRDEAAKYRTKAKELEPLAEKMRELEESKKTDLEKAQDRIKQPEEVGQASGTVC